MEDKRKAEEILDVIDSYSNLDSLTGEIREEAIEIIIEIIQMD